MEKKNKSLNVTLFQSCAMSPLLLVFFLHSMAGNRAYSDTSESIGRLQISMPMMMVFQNANKLNFITSKPLGKKIRQTHILSISHQYKLHDLSPHRVHRRWN